METFVGLCTQSPMIQVVFLFEGLVERDCFLGSIELFGIERYLHPVFETSEFVLVVSCLVEFSLCFRYLAVLVPYLLAHAMVIQPLECLAYCAYRCL